VAFDVRFATLDLTDLDDPTFESSFRTDYIATVAASARLGTHPRECLWLLGWKRRGFDRRASAARDAFKQTLNFVPVQASKP
jgi:hypothetical protein